MECLDLKGKSCPLPVLETKKLIDGGPVDEVEVVVDNDASRENVKRFLESRGFAVTIQEREDCFYLAARRTGPGTDTSPQEARKIAVLIDGETMGRGNDQLGAILMRSFLHTLKELTPLPWRLIFLNTGVRLVAEGSDYLSVIREIEDLGIDVLSCGTCLDFFQLKDKLAAGRVTNMYEIVSTLSEASQVLRP